MEKRLSTLIVATAAFILAVAGMQYTQPFLSAISPVLFFVVEVIMFMCILGAAKINFVSGLLVCAASPVTMLFTKNATIIAAAVLIFANILIVLFLLIFQKKLLVGLAVGIVARFIVAYIACNYVLVRILGGIHELGYGVIDKATINMLITSLIGAAIFYCFSVIGKKKDT